MNQKRNHVYIISLLIGFVGLSGFTLHSLIKQGAGEKFLNYDADEHIQVHRGPQIAFYEGGSSLPTIGLTSTSDFIAAPTTIAFSSVAPRGNVQMSSRANSKGMHTSSAKTMRSYGGGATAACSSSRSSKSNTANTQNGRSDAYCYLPISAAHSRLLASNSAVTTGRGETMNRAEMGTTAGGPRKVYSSGAVTDGNGNYWDEDDEMWKPIPGGESHEIGDTKVENGVSYTWNGSAWVLTSPEVNLNTPVGEVPMMLIMLLLGIHILKRKKSEIA